MRRAGLFCVALAIAIVPAAGGAVLPPVDWMPNSFILPPFVSVSGSRVALVHNTLRIEPHVQGRMLLGHVLFGLWHSIPGYGWTPLTPQCLSIVADGVGNDPLGVLPGCGVNGIATDGLAVYVNTFNIGFGIQNGTLTATINPGGVYKSEIRVGQNLRVGTAGLTWHRLLGGVRGNALAIRRTGSSTTIVAGRIQRTNAPPDVGTDTNIACAGAGCSPSVYTSFDDGTSWQAHTFAGSPCPNGPADIGTSSRLVGNIAFDPINGNVVYAAANSGLWVSTSGGGEPWTLAFNSCGNAPGFAVTRTGRAYVGQNSNIPSATTSTIWTAAAGAGGTGAFQQMSLFDAATGAPTVIQGWTQTIMTDARDASGRTLFVAGWRNADAFSRGQGGVYRIAVDPTNPLRGTVTNLKASFLENCAGLSASPLCTGINDLEDNPLLPYPLIFDRRWGPSTFLAQHPTLPDLVYASSVLGGVWTRSDG
jgi:hypothetical protein